MFRKSQFLPFLRTSAFAGFFAVTFLAIITISGCAKPPKSVTVAAAATTIDGTDSTTLTATVKNDSNDDGVSWTVSGGGFLSNQTNVAATYTAPAATSAAQTVIITATSVAQSTISNTVTITVPAAVQVTTNGLPGDLVGTPYSQQLTASGGIPPYSWQLTSGTLPSCLTMSPAGVISGTPVASCVGTATGLVFKVTDSGTANALSAISLPTELNIAPAPPVQLPPAGLLPVFGVIGTPYNFSVAATGGAGALNYTISAGALPTGLTIGAGGAITGTPTAAGTFSFTVMAADAFGDSQTQSYSIKINYPAVTISPVGGALPIAFTGSAYAQSLTAGGGSGAGYVWTITGLPADGITATPNGATLAIAGTPTSASTVAFTASVKDGAGNTIGPFSYTIPVDNPISLPATNPSSLPANTSINVAYSGTITASGGSGSGYTWTVTGLSDGLTSSNVGGTLTISGTPTTASTVTFQVSVKDSSGSSTGPITYTITVNSVLTLPATNPGTLPGSAIVGTAYSGSITASGGSGTGYTFTVTGLPSDGISSSATGGTLTVSGTPTTTSTVTFNVSVKDSLGNTAGPITYTINVYNPISLPASPNTLPATATVGTVYSGTILITGGSGTGYTVTVTGLPANGLVSGLQGNANSETVTISGTPTSAGPVTFQVSVKDSAGNTAGPLTYTINVYAGLTLPSSDPSTLGPATVNAAYSGTVTVGGGSGSGYVWTITGLPSDGLNYSTNGATLTVSGTPTSATTVSFTASVKDSANNTTGTITYTIPVYNTLTLPTPNPGTLPSNANVGTAYSGTIVAAGGSGSGYVFTVSGLSDGLSFASSGNTLTISGTPTSASTVTFNVSVKDSANNSVGPLTYTINVNAPLTLPTPNPITLPSATVSQTYQGSINATGGVLPYTWTVNSSVVSNNGTPVALAGGEGLNVSASNTNILSFGGTPTASTNVTFTVSVKDSVGNTAGPFTYNIQINTSGSQFSGQIQLINTCGPASTLPTFTVSINTNPVQQTTTDSNGNYTFASIPDGNYTITPSIVGPSSVFYPATQTNVAVNNSTVQGINFQVALGYTVSGNVSYSGSKTGQVYLQLNSNNCGGGSQLGTSIPFSSLGSGGAFTIHGVSPGSYNLTGNIDNLGFGSANATNPTGNTPNLTLTTSNLTGVAVTLTDPTLGVPTQAPKIQEVTPTNLGAVINFKPITNGNGIESVGSYLLEWSTDSTFNSGINSITFKAVGTDSNVWFVNNGTAGISGSFVNGTAYYFRARGQLTVGNGPFGTWGGGTPTAVTIGTPTEANTITGTVIIPAGITLTGPLYAGFYDQNTGAVYAERIQSPVTGAVGNNYSVTVPTSTDPMFNFAILDQNNDGIIDTGDVSNTDNGGNNGIVISGSLSNQDITLSAAGVTAVVQTQFFSTISTGGTSPSYQLDFDLRGADKLPVSVELISGPNVLSPIDIGACTTCGHQQFQTFASLGGGSIPNVGDTYAFSVTYSDGSTQTVNALVTGWGASNNIVDSSDLASNLVASPAGSTTPTFTWTYPPNASSFTYDFQIYPTSGGNTIWQIPGNDSNLNGFPSTVTQIVWGTDPTGDTSNTPNPATLTTGTQYQWSIQVQDVNGNSATTQVYYTP